MRIDRYLLAVALSVCSFSPHAQQPSTQPAFSSGQRLANTLLWRISGKDHHHISYLYGTMHLTDERVFNLGDSLYAAIHNSEGFANELDINSLSSFVIEEVQREIDSSKNIRGLLSDKEYKTYGPLLEKKLKKPLKDITSEDILREKHKWINEAYRTGRMQTFLDVYLLDIARRQDKWTGGIEDMEDQRGLVNDVVDNSDIRDLVAEDHSREEGPSALQQMIAVYLRQDLNSIDTMYDSKRDIILTKRNLKMAQRMDSLSSIRSMVFAVGAAHLPGEQGLISLLRKRGFEVEPVFSARKIKASDYVVKEIPLTWQNVKDDNGFYQVSMPGKPGDVTLYSILKMKMYFDFFNGTGYFTMAAASAFSPSRTDSMMDLIGRQIFKQNGQSYTPVTVNGAHGRSYTVRDLDGYKRGYLLIKDGIFYAAFGAAGKETDRNRQDIDRFLHSFGVLDWKRSEVDSLTMALHIDSVLAYRIATPGIAKLYAGAPKAADWNSLLYIDSDPRDGSLYFFGVNTIIPGHFVFNDSAFFSALKKNVQDKLSTVTLDTTYLADDQLITETQGRMKQADMGMTTRYIARGNRWYGLVAIYPLSGPTPKVKKFLSSFAKLDYPAHTWQTVLSGDSVFSTWAPSGLKKGRDSASDASVENQYIGFDSSRSQSYTIAAYHLSPYYWSLSDSAFWAQRIAGHITYKDSLIYKRPVSNGEAKGWEYVKKEHGAHVYQRHRLLLNGDRIYSLIVGGPLKEIQSPDNNRFFDDFRFSGHPAPTSYFTPKAKKLLSDLFSEDSVLAAKALANLGSAPFTKEDLPLLQQALLKRAPLDRKRKVHYSINNSIENEISSLNDSSTFRFAADNYKKIPDSEAVIKNCLLELMVKRHDSAHFAEMFSLLRTSPPMSPLPYMFLWRLKDSLRLTAVFFPELLPLLKDSLMQPSLLSVSARLLDSNLLDVRQLQPYQEDIVRHAADRIRVLSAWPDSSKVFDEELVDITGRFNDSHTNLLLTRFLHVKDKEIKLTAVKALLRKRQPLAAADLQSLAANRATRISLYNQLEEAGQTALFPVTFRTQKAFAESIINAVVEEDDEQVDSLVFITAKLFTTPGGQKKFFFFKLRIGEETRLACAGPYDQDPANLGIKKARAVINYKETIDAAPLSGQMDRLSRELE